jgi:hypothetical protein
MGDSDGGTNPLGHGPTLGYDTRELLESVADATSRKTSIGYEPEEVVGDFQYATEVNTQAGVLRFPIWLSLQAIRI